MNDLRLTGSVELQAAAASAPTFTGTAYTGGVITVAGWGAVAINLRGLEIPRRLPLLADHEASASGVLGSVTAAVKDNQLTVSGEISLAAEGADKIIKLAKDGVPWQLSVGVQPTKTERVLANETIKLNGKNLVAPNGGLLVVREGKLREISVVVLGADSETSLSIAARAAKGILNMEENVIETNGSNGVIIAERERAKKVAKLFSKFRMDLAAKLSDRLLARLDQAEEMAIDGELTLEAASEELTAILRASRPVVNTITTAKNDSVNGSDLLTAAVMLHCGLENVAVKTLGEQVTQRARDLGLRHIMDLEKVAARLEGRPVHRDAGDMLRASGGLSSMTLPNALGNSLRLAMVAAYREAPRTWQGFAARRAPVDFREQTSVRPSAFENLEEVGPNGEVKHGSFSEESIYSYTVGQYARQVRIDRKMIVNDHLNWFADVAPGLGRAAARSVNDLVYRTLLANSGSFFSSGNANLVTGAGTALSVTSLGTGLAAMLSRTDSAGNIIDMQPKTLLVPPELRETAIGLLESDFLSRISSSDNLPTGNTLKNSLELAVEPRLSNSGFTGYSTTAWYLFAPADAMPVVVAFLNGQEAPMIESWGPDADPDHLSYAWRVVLDYGAAFGDFRAARKAAGA